MVENTFGSVNKLTDEGAINGMLCTEILELKLKVAKIEGEEEKILFCLDCLGKQGYEWYKKLGVKPQTWEEMKGKLKEEEKLRDEELKKIEEKKQMEVEIALRVEKEVRRASIELYRRRSENKGYKQVERGDIVCHRCNKSGHVAKWCKNTPFWEKINKNNENYLSLGLKSKYIVKGIESEKENTLLKRRKVSLDKIIEEYPNVFINDEYIERIKFCLIEECKIETEEGKTVCKRGTVIPQALRQKAKEYIGKLILRGIIRKSDSQWRMPIRIIEKADGSVRLVQNCIPLNEITIKDNQELPRMSRIVEATVGSKFITVLDLKEAYYHIPITEEDRYKTAFEFDGQVFEWCGMVMGFKNAPMIFQRIMNKILGERIGDGVEVYLDDVIIYNKSMEEHNQLVRWVLQKFSENNLKVNKKKVQFGMEEVKLLGLTVNGKEKIPIEQKKNEALIYPEPQCFSELRRFLGLMGWFRQFIPRFADVAKDLYDCVNRKTGFIWTEREKNAFYNLKNTLMNAGKLKLPEYNKKFVLKTDASNSGLGAVLLQEDGKGELIPVQWASKKLTDTQTRYSISEKEMLAVKWGIEKFSYELKGRRFHIITDHKALEHIRNKPEFSNNRINRMVEAIQDYDFSIEYKKGPELVTADALSRIYEEETKKANMKKKEHTEKGKKIVEGRLNKHVIEMDGEQFWRFDSGIVRKIPKINERNDLIIQTHEKLKHRGLEAVYYDLKKEYYWLGMSEEIKETLKKCQWCIMGNRKRKQGFEFVITNRRGERIGIDIMKLSEEDRVVLIIVDYFTRFVCAEIIRNRSSSEIIKQLIKIFEKIGTPELIVSDNAKEFTSEEFKKFCERNEINHYKTSIESHNSNGRIERVIKTVRDALFKNKGENIEEDIESIVRAYNNTYHTGIKCTPEEAWYDYSGKAQIENSKLGKYQKRFKMKQREKFVEGQQIKVAKHENLRFDVKNVKGRFVDDGIVVGKAGNDSYLIKMANGKYVKKRYHDLKGLGIFVGETPSGEGDVV